MKETVRSSSKTSFNCQPHRLKQHCRTRPPRAQEFSDLTIGLTPPTCDYSDFRARVKTVLTAELPIDWEPDCVSSYLAHGPLDTQGKAEDQALASHAEALQRNWWAMACEWRVRHNWITQKQRIDIFFKHQPASGDGKGELGMKHSSDLLIGSGWKYRNKKPTYCHALFNLIQVTRNNPFINFFTQTSPERHDTLCVWMSLCGSWRSQKSHRSQKSPELLVFTWLKPLI